MGNVHVIHPVGELERFFDYIYGDETGYVYSPTKDPVGDGFEQYFFSWPTEKQKLLDHVEKMSITHEVYYGVGLFNERRADKENFKGSRVVWAEFDGTLPDTSSLAKIPYPSIKIQSSTSNHQHWYWKLSHFERDSTVIETITKRLAYHLKADLGCWNSNRVLRPPGTLHHSSNKTVTLLRWDTIEYSAEEFAGLPEAPIKLLQEEDIHHIPPVLDVIMKYRWSNEDSQFFQTREIKEPGRSSALYKLAAVCMEMGMTNAETLSVLFNADKRWKKYEGRRDQKNRLIGIINSCRIEHPNKQAEEEESRFRVFTFKEFSEHEAKVEWLLPGFLHAKGLLGLSGPAGVGKTQVSLRFAERLARGEPFLKWKPERPAKVIFVSMEMQHEELKYFTDQMSIPDTDNLMIMPVGSSIGLRSKASQIELAKVAEKYEPDGFIFDSLGVAVGDDIDSQKVMLEVFDYINRILRKQYGCFAWFIHHHRKGQIGNKKPNKLDDLFGSGYIGNQLSTAVCLWPFGSEIEVSCLKLRMEPNFESFKIRRRPGLDFEEISNVRKIVKDRPILTVDQDDSEEFNLEDTI